CPSLCPQQLVVGGVTRLWLGTRFLSAASVSAPHTLTCPQGYPRDTPDPRVTQLVSSAVASPAVEDEVDVTELEMPEEYSGCLGASEKQALGVPSMPGTATCRYVLISLSPVTAVSLQRICARRFHGRLASIHDSRTNTFLLLLARRQCRAGQVWIGAIPFPSCHWTDRSPWNYSQWVPGHPLPGHRFCTALCTNSQWGLYGRAPGGLWGSPCP
uniref:C-type lectin domain-containing protein n=1 Tax=Zosterops lateralis melanops TaxID=1220523 RepID=A0A8D2P3G3_ZOSLA